MDLMLGVPAGKSETTLKFIIWVRGKQSPTRLHPSSLSGSVVGEVYQSGIPMKAGS